ncbi:TrbC/VirB2 family protein [Hydrogenophaga pseudoflava]|jgi:type IV secretion system protein VirB2|uniref:TrbC/VirB2 family protein n=1 Tax=Hydrogenophaga pseudoflava TaxID=47421 RepID=UPI0027E59EE3|nr:TrbC/VirB2 family protein [Hydrogenophaga pseudoflava]MDQ7746886.1 TrbC/VirB2 family protein [Hydrogenophaga pseudoflava]
MTPSTALRSFARPFTRLLVSSWVASLHRLNRLMQPARQGLLTASIMLSLAGTAKAAGSSMPWEGPLQSILDSIQGPVARIVAVIIIIATGLALAFGDTSGGFRKLIQIVFGLSIAFAASSFFLSFFSFSGGALV